jgi:hypothetical protein
MEVNKSPIKKTAKDKRKSFSVASTLTVVEEKKNLKSFNETDFDNDIPMFFSSAAVVKKKGPLHKKKNFCSSETFLISHNNRYKGWWDLFMTVVLLATCLLTPYNIAFSAEES